LDSIHRGHPGFCKSDAMSYYRVERSFRLRPTITGRDRNPQSVGKVTPIRGVRGVGRGTRDVGWDPIARQEVKKMKTKSTSAPRPSSRAPRPYLHESRVPRP